MKITMVAGPFVPVPPIKYGGTERVIYYLVKGLVERGHEVTLLASGDSQVCEEVDCQLIPIVDEHVFFGKTEAEQAQIKKRVDRIEQRTAQLLTQLAPEVDIVHSHGFDLQPFSDVPNVTTLHGMFTLEKMEYYEERRDLHYVTISENQQEPFPDLQYAGVAYNGLDPEEFPVVTQPEDYVCFLGRFDREKNPHLAIELAINYGIKIKVAGKIDFLGNSYFKRRVEKYLDHPLVEYLGEIGMAEKIELLSNAKCNLHPTGFREPFGLTVLESAYCGTPTLAIERGSMQELIEEERTGILVEDFEEGYHRLEDCFEMDRAYVAQRARMLFNYHNMAQQYEEAYEKVLRQFQSQAEGEEAVDLEVGAANDASPLSLTVKGSKEFVFR